MLELSHVDEKLVDTVLLEELACSATFLNWFFARAWGLNGPAVFASCDEVSLYYQRSEYLEAVTAAGDVQIRKPDIMIHSPRHNSKTYIENKINAPFANDQEKSYERLQHELSASCNCKTVLIAPARRLLSPEARYFCDRISYEEMTEFFQRIGRADQGSDSSRRGMFCASVLSSALQKNARPQHPIHKSSHDFYKRYCELAKAVVPHLRPREYNGAPGNDYYWFEVLEPYSRNLGLQRNLRFKHKLFNGIIQIEFPQWAAYTDQFKTRIPASTLPSNVALDSAGKSMALMVRVPCLYRSRSFEEQEGQVRQCFAAAASFCEWFQDNWRMFTLQH